MTTQQPNSYTKQDYQGGKSTLCVGCGHDLITNHIIAALLPIEY